MSVKKITKGLLKDFSDALGTGGQGGNSLTNLMNQGASVVSVEDMDGDKLTLLNNSKQAVQTQIREIVEAMVTNSYGDDASMDTVFTKAQIAACESIVAFAANAKDTLTHIATNGYKTLQQSSTNNKLIGVEDYSVVDSIDSNMISVEAYDGQSTTNAMYFSVIYNLFAAKQDEFGELFFPTIAIDPLSAGAVISVEYMSLISEVKRSASGSTDKSKFNMRPIIKHVYDNNIFNIDKNRVVPVMTASNEDMFYKDAAYSTSVSGEDIDTAPLKIGKKVSLLGISQTESLIAKGVMDQTDALDRRVILDELYMTLDGKNAAGTAITEVFRVDVSKQPGSNFTFSPQGHNKSLQLAFSSETIGFNTGITKQSDGTASALLGALPANYTIVFDMVLSGASNTQDSDMAVYANSVTLKEVRNAAGVTVATTDTVYTTIATAINDNVAIVGYTLEAYRTNSNFRTRGQLVTSTRETWSYTVPLRSGISIQTPVNPSISGDDGDANKLSDQITYAGLRTSAEAVQELVDFESYLHGSKSANTLTAESVNTVGSYFVNPYFNQVSLPIDSMVDSIKSADRLKDIRSALVNQIRNEALSAMVDSNYLVAHRVMSGNLPAPITVIIGTDPVIYNFLTDENGNIDLGNNLKVAAAYTPNKLVDGKIYVSFGIFDSERNTTPNPLNYGQCFWAPTISTLIQRSSGGVSKELNTNPRFKHITNLPILSVFDVSALSSALGKVTVNMKTV